MLQTLKHPALMHRLAQKWKFKIYTLLVYTFEFLQDFCWNKMYFVKGYKFKFLGIPKWEAQQRASELCWEPRIYFLETSLLRCAKVLKSFDTIDEILKRNGTEFLTFQIKSWQHWKAFAPGFNKGSKGYITHFVELWLEEPLKFFSHK